MWANRVGQSIELILHSSQQGFGVNMWLRVQEITLFVLELKFSPRSVPPKPPS